jgi:pilus assembly protein Flp/PilA
MTSHLLKSDDRGATMVEYGLMLALIALVCVLAVTALGLSLNGLFSNPALLAALLN